MERLTRGQAIRNKCLDCMCGNTAEVRRCPSSDCPLYRYRLGREDANPSTDIPEATDEETGSVLVN